MKKIIFLTVLATFSLPLIISFSCKARNIYNLEILERNSLGYTTSELLDTGKVKFEPFTSERNATDGEIWLRFIYHNSEDQKAYYLYYPFILFKELNLYFKIGDSTHHFKSGISVPFSKRNLFTSDTYIELPMVTEPVVCLLHVNSIVPQRFFLSIRETKSVIKKEVQAAKIEYFLLGIGSLTVVFSLIFFIYLKDRLYLYYALFSLMLILSRLTFSGYLFQYILPWYSIVDLKSAVNLYTIPYELLSIFLILYFYEYL